MKKTIVLLGYLGLALSASTSFAAVELAALENDARPFDTLPLMQWDEPDLMAQQQPAPTTPQPIPQPVTPPAPATPPPAVTPPAAPPEAAPLPGDDVDPNLPPESANEEDLSLGDIPVVETIEMTTDKAKKALDTYLMVREKYKDAELENYENLQDFVDLAPQGKAFDADVKAAGFPNVTEWNTTVTTLSFAYDNSINDQTADTKAQIAELEKDTETAKDMRDRMIKALQAMIPSDNNKKVVDEMKADPVYAEKLKILETETE